MTKTLKQILEGYEARSADEKRFIDKHVVVKHEDRNGNGDDVFKAKKTKYIKRKEEGHGHDAGEDHLVYEEVEDLSEARGDAKRASYEKLLASHGYKKNDKDVWHHPDGQRAMHMGSGGSTYLYHSVEGHVYPGGSTYKHNHFDAMGPLKKHLENLHGKPTKLKEEVLGEETIGHFSNAGPFIRITKGTDRVTKKPTRHVEIHNGKAKTRLITSVDPKWDNAKIKDHLLKTHGDKLKPVTWKLNEEVLDEGQDLQYGRKPKVVTKKYSWGKMKTIHKGADFSIPMHPEHHEPISKLKDGESHHFTDETRTHWTATRSGDDVHFQSSVGKVKVPHASLNEEVLDEAVPSHMYHRTSNGPVNPSAVAGAHHTTPEQRRAAKLKREAKEKLKEETQLTEAAKLIKRVKRALKAGK